MLYWDSFSLPSSWNLLLQSTLPLFLPYYRYAYVTIHYEGTKRDDEYALAVRVWAKSLFAHGISRRRVCSILISRARCYHSSEWKCPRVYKEAVPWNRMPITRNKEYWEPVAFFPVSLHLDTRRMQEDDAHTRITLNILSTSFTCGICSTMNEWSIWMRITSSSTILTPSLSVVIFVLSTWIHVTSIQVFLL